MKLSTLTNKMTRIAKQAGKMPKIKKVSVYKVPKVKAPGTVSYKAQKNPY